MTVHISKGNSKLGNIPNISLPPVQTCAKGMPCASSGCYGHKLWKLRPSVRKAWAENLAEFMFNKMGYFRTIRDYLLEEMPDRFRWHVAGDIPNQEYLRWMKHLARLVRYTRFLAFTKKYDLNYSGLPDNLSVIVSAWPGLARVEVYSDGRLLPTAWCQDGTEKRIPRGAKECPGSCRTCNFCWDPKGRDVWFKKH